MSDYRRTLAEKCVPIGKAVNPEIACVTPMMVHRDEQEAIRRGMEGGNFFGFSLAHFYVFGDHVPGKTNVWEEFQEKRHEMGYDPEVAVALEQERRNRHEDIMESLELFGKEILPEFKDRDEANRARKFAELEGAIEAAMTRRVDDAPPLPKDYVMTPLARDFVKQVGGGERILEDVARRTAVGEGLESIEGRIGEQLEEAAKQAAR